MSEGERTRTLWNGAMEVRVFSSHAEAEGPALVFETDLGRRYAFKFPANWEELSDAELLDVSNRAPD